MPRYFFGENAGRPIRAGGKQYAFAILSISGGTQQGVVAVPDAEADAFLAVAARWVHEITQAAYEEALQKKTANRRLPATPDLTAPVRPGPALKGHGAVVVDGAAFQAAQAASVVAAADTLFDAVDLGRADAPVERVEAKPKPTERVNHRQKRGMK